MPSRPSRPQRLRVWRGELRKTSGGLTRDDLVKNSKGKIVSRRKSKQAGEQNNLGVWLRSKGDKFGDKPAKAAPNKQQPKQAEAKPKVKPKPVLKEKPVPKPRPKLRLKLALKEKPKPKPAPVVPKPKPKPALAKPKEYGVSKKDITVRNIVRLSRKQQEEAKQRAKLEYLEARRARKAAKKAARDAKWAKR